MDDNEIQTILSKWHEVKLKLDDLEEKIKKYKSLIAKEMNFRNVEKISSGSFSVTRRRTTRSTLSKESVPENIWKEYATKCSFDVFNLIKK